MLIVKALKIGDCPMMSNGLGIYLHGTLEKENGFDLCEVDINKIKKDGTYMVDCILTNGNVRRSNLYFWRIGTQIRGLVVDCDDREGNIEARTLYNERSNIL